MARAVDVVREIAPCARPDYVEAFERGDALLAAAGITTPLRLAHFLAQTAEETGAYTVTFENMNYRAGRIVEIFGAGRHSAAVTPAEARELAGHPEALAERVYGLGNPKKAHELGNTQPGDGFRYRGGGILQTTGRGAYRLYGAQCGVDFENDPGLIITAEHALKPALGEWMQSRCNELADRDDIAGITKRINGGYVNFDQRKAWYAKIRPLIDRVELLKPEASVAPAAPAPSSEVPAASLPNPPSPPGRASSSWFVTLAQFLASLIKSR